MANNKKNYNKGSQKKVSYQKGMNRRNSSKQQRREAEMIDTGEEVLSKTNDSSWYNRFPQLVRDVASISFGRPLGRSTSIALNNPKRPTVTNETVTIPGIMSLNFYPAIGYSEDKYSAVNRSAVRLYTYMRSHLKTSSDYDSQDMMMAVIALDSAYAFHKWMQRIYGIAQLYTPVNYYYPRALLSAAGASPDEFVNGNILMQLRAYINTYAIALGQWCVPNNIDLFNRHQWMCAGLYTDGTEERAQTYLFRPIGFWQYNNTVTTGSQLDFVKLPFPATLKQIMEYGDNLIKNLMGDEDIANISGDLLNAFGPNAMMRADETPENYRILPTYDSTVLMQIENADFVGEFTSGSSFVISQDPSVNAGAIMFQPVMDVNPTTMSWDAAQHIVLTQKYKMLNFHVDSPQPLDIIEATRFTVRHEPTDADISPLQIKLKCFGADLLKDAHIWTIRSGAPQGLEFTGSCAYSTSASKNQVALEATTALSQFDWSPQLYWYATSGSGASISYKYLGWMCDAGNVGFVDAGELQDIHDTVMISLFDIPENNFRYPS